MKSSKKELKLFNNAPSPIFGFIILLLISFSLMGLDYRKGIHHEIRNKSTFVITPIIYFLNLPRNSIRSLQNFFESKSRLFEKNQELENRVINLTIENQRLDLIEAENKQLRKSMNIKNILSVDSISAEIILPKINNGKEIILINKGLKNGINIGQPVINNLGLIGQVIFVGDTFSEINPITSKKYMVPAIFEKGSDNIIVKGNGNKYLEVTMFPSHRKVKIGNILMTSGIDNLYPKGIKIGRIIKITPQLNNQFNHLLIAPFSRPVTFSQVRIFVKKEND